MPAVTILCVRPHPDDECTGTGGITAYYAARDVPVGVLTCTRGEEGEILDPSLDAEEARPRLGEIRELELRAACQVLGVKELRLLGYRDSGMPGTQANQRRDAFCNAPLDEAGARVAAVIRELRPRVVVTENEYGTYGHPDHVMCHKAAVRGVALAGDPSLQLDGLEPWRVDRLLALQLVTEGGERIANMLRAEQLDLGWFGEDAAELAEMGIKSSEADAAVDVGDYAETLRAALAQHRTQIPSGHFLLTWPLHILREVFRTAYFTLLLEGHGPKGKGKRGKAKGEGRKLSDLLEGLPGS